MANVYVKKYCGNIEGEKRWRLRMTGQIQATARDRQCKSVENLFIWMALAYRENQ